MPTLNPMGMTQPLLTITRCPPWLPWEPTCFLVVFQWGLIWCHTILWWVLGPRSLRWHLKDRGVFAGVPSKMSLFHSRYHFLAMAPVEAEQLPGDVGVPGEGTFGHSNTQFRIQHFKSLGAQVVLTPSLCWGIACLQSFRIQICRKSYLSWTCPLHSTWEAQPDTEMVPWGEVPGHKQPWGPRPGFLHRGWWANQPPECLAWEVPGLWKLWASFRVQV